MSEANKKAPSEDAASQDSAQAEAMPVVGIGASAGGIAALKAFFDQLPQQTGMAFVVVLHLSPDYESSLAELLQNHTSLPVKTVVEGDQARVDHVYVIPPGTELTLEDGHLHLVASTEAAGLKAPIDRFFRSLARDRHDQAVAIILSGTGTDGTQGMCAVKEAGGLTMVQDPDDAEYEGMPRSAIATGLIDVRLPAPDLAAKLIEYHAAAAAIPRLPKEDGTLPQDKAAVLQKILTQVYAQTGHDFVHYKRSTVMRRIGRRLQVNQITSLSKYLRFLRSHPEEGQALLRDLLISITTFFRDPEEFRALEKQVLPRLFAGKQASDQLRVWIAGCATGEEAYSIAMLLLEHAEELDSRPDLQLFATDISEAAIAAAREGLYPESIAADVTPERLARFFRHDGVHYQARKELRELILFAEHNVLRDPPFSKLDLISCRNLLIYLDRDMQERVFDLFHYALNPEGFLFLGTSESAGVAGHLFAKYGQKQGLFQRRTGSRVNTRLPALPLAVAPTKKAPAGKRAMLSSTSPPSVGEVHQRLLMHEVASVIVDEHYEIVHLSARAGRYLVRSGGEPTHNVLDGVSKGMRLHLRGALYQAFQKGQATVSLRVPMEVGGEARLVDVQVRPVQDIQLTQPFAQVVFEEHPRMEAPERPSGEAAPSGELLVQLEDELRRTKERLQTVGEEYDTTTEEMKAANEELLSMNEELQSANEELETSKEELQSVNEELKTTNQELKVKIEEVSQGNSDLLNLMDSTAIPTLFLDRAFCIKLYTPRVTELYNIMVTDLGRSLADLTPKMHYEGLLEDAARVLKDLGTIEREAQSADGQWYMVRLRPYRTVEDKIDGVVITFIEITERKRHEQQLKQEQNLVSTILDTVGTLIVVWNAQGRVLRLNRVFTEVTGYTQAELAAITFWTFFAPTSELQEVIRMIADRESAILHYERPCTTKDGRQRLIDWSSALLQETGDERVFVSAGLDITDRLRLEREILEISEEERRRLGMDLHDQLASHLAGITMMLQAVVSQVKEGEPIEESDLEQVARLLGDGAEQARMLSRGLVPVRVEEDGLSAALEELMVFEEERSGISCVFETESNLPDLSRGVAAVHLYRIAQEAVRNAIRHAQPNRVVVHWFAEGNRLVLEIEDDGTGLADPDQYTAGLGLHTMRYRARLIGASLQIMPGRDGGTLVRCTLPLEADSIHTTGSR